MGAILRRMNGMLRCAVPHSSGYVASHLRGAFLEYNYYLYTLAHELEYDSIMDWDQALLELRKNGEWEFDQPVPSTSDIKNHWRVKVLTDQSCIFCGKRKFTTLFFLSLSYSMLTILYAQVGTRTIPAQARSRRKRCHRRHLIKKATTNVVSNTTMGKVAKDAQGEHLSLSQCNTTHAYDIMIKQCF